MLKSTARSAASKHGLASQKSRDTNMTMPVLAAQAAAAAATASQADVVIVPDSVKALQDKRLIAQLQSAPGRSRARMTQARQETLNASASQAHRQTPAAPQQADGNMLLPDLGDIHHGEGSPVANVTETERS